MRWPCCKLPPRDWGHSFRPASRRPLGICRVTIYDFPPPLGTNRHENDIHAALTRLECNGIPQRPIAFYGSSSFCLWRAIAEDLGSLDVVNLGFGGSTLLSAVYHMDRLLLPLNPVKIVLYFGENDIANDGLTAASTFTHFLALREEIAKWLPEVHVFAMSVKHSPARWPFADEVDRYNGLRAGWCNARTDTTWIGAGAGLIGENGRPTSHYFLPDLIHMATVAMLSGRKHCESPPDCSDRP